MTEVLSGDLADDQPVNRRQIMPADQLRELIAEVEHVLGEAPDGREAVFLAHFFAPRLAAIEDARLQASQAGVALAESMAASMQIVGHHVWLKDVAYRRWQSAQRLREELAVASLEADRFRSLTEQRCPVGAHTGWFAPSAGRQHRCPWCQILELGGYVGHVDHVAVEAPADEDDDAPPNVLCDLLSLVDVTATEAQVADWTLDQRRAAERWAIATHLSASDNDVDVPARPAFLAVECPAHGSHPHARLRCLDCPQCTNGAS